MMFPLTHITQISDFRNKVKAHSGKVMMNYFISPTEMEGLIREGRVEYAECEGCVLMVVRYPFGDRLIYFAGSDTTLAKAVENIRPYLRPNTILEDIDRNPEPGWPFDCVMTLQFMSRVGTPTSASASPNVKEPSASQLPEVEKILKANFHPVCERVPDLNELKALLEQDNIRIFCEGDDIRGVLVYENDTRNSHLRYWLALPEARGKGVGSALMKEFFRCADASTSQHLWVDINNKNAINRYEHYGFVLSRRFDHIYQIR